MTDTHIPEHVDLELTGMTCAACAMRIEKKLNRLDGVTATVNYATEKASVTFDTTRVQPDALVAAVESMIKMSRGRAGTASSFGCTCRAKEMSPLTG